MVPPSQQLGFLSVHRHWVQISSPPVPRRPKSSVSSPRHPVESSAVMASAPDGREPDRDRPAPPDVPAVSGRAYAADGGGNPPPPRATGTSILGGGLTGLAQRGPQFVQGMSPSVPRNNNVVTTGRMGTPASAVATTNANGTPQASSNVSNRSRQGAPSSHRSAASNNLNAHLAVASAGDPPAPTLWPCPKNCGNGPWPMTRKRCSCQAWRPGARMWAIEMNEIRAFASPKDHDSSSCIPNHRYPPRTPAHPVEITSIETPGSASHEGVRAPKEKRVGVGLTYARIGSTPFAVRRHVASGPH
ncbi:hypothetical protein THAOC_14690 [Thalassiosira oceanica]|uniref:Uncharacterized protein n=1 Tax=Thalassiosira oceanica TaxID=159749 RepID=K0SU97_THAOC|nr:hypothetical protein THAOC_14690 [Thalassiosira oceanica]|eukprot:EJK64566.1 hypothetical protein THAOC_14690 [Thalassiosira oceanica]